MAHRRRLTLQQEQEELSRNEFSSCLLKHRGWLADPLRPDLGEDFIVRIYDNGTATGLTFFVQLKSTTKLRRLKTNDEQISFSIEVADIEHWNNFASPIFLVIWDIIQNQGYWARLTEVVQELEQRIPNWKQKTKVNIRVPYSNQLDGNGLKHIRKLIADYNYPSVAQGKELNVHIAFRFPNTENGNKAREDFERFHKTGDPVYIEKEYIEAIDFPDWYSTLYGENELPTPDYLRFIPKISEQPIPTGIDLLTQEGVHLSIPYIDLRVTKQGSEEATLSNEHQNHPLHFTLVVPLIERNEVELSMQLGSPSSNVQHVGDALAFMLGMLKGSRIRLIDYTTGHITDFTAPNESLDAPFNPEDLLVLWEAINKLCFIQRVTGQSITLEYWKLLDQDIHAINNVYAICKYGQTSPENSVNTPYRVAVMKPGLKMVCNELMSGNSLKIIKGKPDTIANLFGTVIHLGRSETEIIGELLTPCEEIYTDLENMEDKDTKEIEYSIVSAITSYANWPNELMNEL